MHVPGSIMCCAADPAYRALPAAAPWQQFSRAWLPFIQLRVQTLPPRFPPFLVQPSPPTCTAWYRLRLAAATASSGACSGARSWASTWHPLLCRYAWCERVCVCVCVEGGAEGVEVHAGNGRMVRINDMCCAGECRGCIAQHGLRSCPASMLHVLLARVAVRRHRSGGVYEQALIPPLLAVPRAGLQQPRGSP